MMFRLLLLCWLTGCCACQTPRQSASPTPASQLSFRSLEAINLSEDRLHLSTHDDEILLLLVHYDQRHLLQRDTAFELLFDSLHMSHSLPYHLPLIEGDYLVCTLLELDNEAFNPQILTLINNQWAEGGFLQKINRSRIDSLLGYDDFLGMQYWQMEAMEKGEVQKLTFKGLQLFDRFEYQLLFTAR
ncbi:MAG: hypothetical protein AAGG75_26515 [Bacteroidota bacterium]